MLQDYPLEGGYQGRFNFGHEFSKVSKHKLLERVVTKSVVDLYRYNKSMFVGFIKTNLQLVIPDPERLRRNMFECKMEI